MIILISGSIILEMLFLYFYVNTQLKFKKLIGTGRMYDIDHTRHLSQLYKILIICLPVIAFLIKDLFI